MAQENLDWTNLEPSGSDISISITSAALRRFVWHLIRGETQAHASVTIIRPRGIKKLFAAFDAAAIRLGETAVPFRVSRGAPGTRVRYCAGLRAQSFTTATPKASRCRARQWRRGVDRLHPTPDSRIAADFARARLLLWNALSARKPVESIRNMDAMRLAANAAPRPRARATLQQGDGLDLTAEAKALAGKRLSAEGLG